MGFDLSNATPVDDSDTSFDLANAKPVSKVQNYTLPDGSMHTSLGGPLPAGAIPNGKQSPLTSGWDTFWSGAGKAPVDLARGAGQWLGLESRGDVAESRKLDAPLMATTMGKVGNLAGDVATLLPTAFIPGANTVAGAGAIGAASGLLQPSTSTKETLENTGLGGALGSGGILAGRGLAGVTNLAAGLVNPFTPGGTQRIAARALQTFAGSPADAQTAAANLSNPLNVMRGLQPTTAELANNPGLSQLQRSLQNNPEFNTALTGRMQANRAAMTQAIGGIAGTDAQMDAAQAARTQGVSALYDAAGKASAPLDNEMTALLQRPSMQAAITRAQSLAQENGHTFGLSATIPGLPTQLSGQDLQYLKMGLSDIANSCSQTGIGAHELGAVKGTLASLNGWITKNVPELKAADSAFADLSKPINQMQVGQQLSAKLIPALNDFGNAGGLNANAFAGAVRNGDQLASKATGWKGAALDTVLTPSQMKILDQVGTQLARTEGTNIGRAVGSNTAQNLIGQDILSQTLGPMGLPKTWAQSVLSKTLMRPIQYAAQAAEPDVKGLLQQAALDPQLAAQLLSAQKNPALAKALWRRQGLLTSPAVGLGMPLGQSLLNPPQQTDTGLMSAPGRRWNQ